MLAYFSGVVSVREGSYVAEVSVERRMRSHSSNGFSVCVLRVVLVSDDTRQLCVVNRAARNIEYVPDVLEVLRHRSDNNRLAGNVGVGT